MYMIYDIFKKFYTRQKKASVILYMSCIPNRTGKFKMNWCLKYVRRQGPMDE